MSLDPQAKDDVRWADPCRAISVAFIEHALTQESWRSSLHFHGFRLSGAKIYDSLDLSGIRSDTGVLFYNSQFDSQIILDYARFERLILFESSTLINGFAARGLQVDSALYLTNTAVHGGPVDLSTADIKGQLITTGSTFEAGFTATALRVGSYLTMDNMTIGSGFSASGLQVGNDMHLENTTVRGNPVVLTRASVKGAISTEGCTFDAGFSANGVQVGVLVLEHTIVRGGSVDLSAAEIKGVMSTMGSTFEAGFGANSLQVGNDALLTNTTVQGGPVDLSTADIKGQLITTGSTFEAGFTATALRVGSYLTLQNTTIGTSFQAGGLQVGNDVYLGNTTVRGGPIDLTRASIKGAMSAMGSTFEAGFSANGLQVGAALVLEKTTVRGGPVDLTAVDIKGPVSTEGSSFEADFIATGLQVGSYALLGRTTFTRGPYLPFAYIKGTLDLSEANLPSLDLSRAVVDGELRFGWELGNSPQWQKGAILNLGGARAKVLQDHSPAPANGAGTCTGSDAWPDKLNLQGFVYEQLGASRNHDMRARAACWYKHWLGRDDYISRQPYQHLASVLRSLGDPDRAESVLYAARDRELAKAWRDSDYLEAFKLWVLKITIGYGIGGGVFQVLWWVAGFTALGVLVLQFSPNARRKGLFWCAGASLDHLLPILELNKEFTDYFDDPQRARLKGWQLTYFAIHALVGFLLGSFVVAALAGLTQAA